MVPLVRMSPTVLFLMRVQQGTVRAPQWFVKMEMFAQWARVTRPMAVSSVRLLVRVMMEMPVLQTMHARMVCVAELQSLAMMVTPVRRSRALPPQDAVHP